MLPSVILSKSTKRSGIGMPLLVNNASKSSINFLAASNVAVFCTICSPISDLISSKGKYSYSN